MGYKAVKKRRGLLEGPRPLGIAPTWELACRHNFCKQVVQHEGMIRDHTAFAVI
jgi:hypothetical protein